MKKLLIATFLLIVTFHLSAQNTAKEHLSRYSAFTDSLIANGIEGKEFMDAFKAKVKANTKTIKTKDGFTLSRHFEDFYFNNPEIYQKICNESGDYSGVDPGSEIGGITVNNEDLLYSYLKPFAKWLKKGRIYYEKHLKETVHYMFDLGTISAIADLEGNIQTVSMSFHEAMPIPFEECVSFYKKMTSGKLKLKIRTKHEFYFRRAKYLQFRFFLDPEDQELMQKMESATDLE